jgi:hypothetical protein
MKRRRSTFGSRSKTPSTPRSWGTSRFVASCRIRSPRINSDILELLKYLSFGVPRTYLRLLRGLLELAGKESAQQQVNGIVEAQTELMRAEYDSLRIKLRQFASVVPGGVVTCFDKAVHDVATAQSADIECPKHCAWAAAGAEAVRLLPGGCFDSWLRSDFYIRCNLCHMAQTGSMTDIFLTWHFCGNGAPSGARLGRQA